jgi:hypothetical protein
MAKTAPAPKPAPAARPAAPAGLSPAMARWWDQVLREHELEPHRLHLLELACRAKDRCEEARVAIAQKGTTYEDRFGAPGSVLKSRSNATTDWPSRASCAISICAPRHRGTVCFRTIS